MPVVSVLFIFERVLKRDKKCQIVGKDQKKYIKNIITYTFFDIKKDNFLLAMLLLYNFKGMYL